MDDLSISYLVVMMIISFLIGCCSTTPKIEIQEIKPAKNGYYITINDEIYYKENSNGN